MQTITNKNIYPWTNPNDPFNGKTLEKSFETLALYYNNDFIPIIDAASSLFNKFVVIYFHPRKPWDKPKYTPNFSCNITGVKFHPHYTNSKKNILSPYNFPFTFVYHLLQYLIYLWYTLFEWNIMICFEFLGIFRKIRNLLVEYVWWKINTYSKIYNIVLFTIFVLKFNKL